MKTSVELDDDKVRLAKKIAAGVTLRDLLDKALDAFIAQARRKSMADMLGTHFFKGKLRTMRRGKGQNGNSSR